MKERLVARDLPHLSHAYYSVFHLPDISVPVHSEYRQERGSTPQILQSAVGLLEVMFDTCHGTGTHSRSAKSSLLSRSYDNDYLQTGDGCWCKWQCWTEVRDAKS